MKRYAKVVKFSEIAENDYNLNIRRYADTSPPAEVFDVRAILHGGIPVREVHNEYIEEEILAGFDISLVFDKTSDDYYSFKSSIERKEQILDVVADTGAKVINQLERWWDKYQVSLHELDQQVEEAELAMQGYLKELGYE